MKTNPARLNLSTLLAITTLLVTACGGGADTLTATGVSNSGGGSLGSVALNWQAPLENDDGSALVNLAGFRIYQGTTSDTQALTSIATISNPSVSNYLVENLAAGTYYFALTAWNSDGYQSDFSNVVSVTVN